LSPPAGGSYSNFPVVKKEYLNARVVRRKSLTIRPGCLSLWACECPFDRRKVVEMQGTYQIDIGRSGQYCDRAVADLVPRRSSACGKSLPFEPLWLSFCCLSEMQQGRNRGWKRIAAL
jgi:hypothetical protein